MVDPVPPGHLLVLRPRRPDPTPPARAFPPSRARRSRGRPSISPLVGAVSLIAAALLLVAQSAAATQASYQIATLKQEQARLNAEHDQLLAQLAGDRAANRVATAAQQLGLSHPSRWQYIRATGSPIALRPRPANPGRSGVWDGVLAPLLQLSAADIQVKLATTRQFVYLARRVPSSVAQQLDAMRLPGIGKVAETQRSYVDGGVAGTSLAANLLGFANDEGQGNYGVEGYYNKTLAGQAGFEATVRDLANPPIVLSDRPRRDPVNGMTLQLSLDSTIQVVAERALADGGQKYQAGSGSLIITEPATGRLVAWADVPSYNANPFATTPTAQFIHPIVSSLYEPPSVMKVVTLSGALDDHAITPDTPFNETGVAVVGGVAIRNCDNKAHGNVTMTQILQNSLHVGAIKAQQLEGAGPFYQYLHKVGIGAATGF